ncbi:MAG: hypothetical protein ACKOX6_14755 [Bdellovibrio sp.]
MMRKILITLLLLSVAGCSFSKKSAEEKANDNATAKSRSAVDELMLDQRYSNYEKIATAIQVKDKELFSSLLIRVDSKTLNQKRMTKSLAELALDSGDIFYLSELLKAGMSPYGDVGISNGLIGFADYKGFVEAKKILLESRKSLLARATRTCLLSSVDDLFALIDENLIPPLEAVCGTMDLFEYNLSYKSISSEVAIKILSRYLIKNRADYNQVGQRILYFAFTSENVELWRKIGSLYRLDGVRFYGTEFESLVEKATLASVLESYNFVKTETPYELLNNLKFYVREKIKKAEQQDVKNLNSLIVDSDLVSAGDFESEKPFNFFDCANPPKSITVQSESEDPPPPGEAAYEESSAQTDPRACN